MNKFYVYIVECRDHTLYTGYSNNVRNRVNVHNSGKGAKYTRTRLPVNLRYCSDSFLTKSEALKYEHSIKRMTRSEKMKLIKNYERI